MVRKQAPRTRKGRTRSEKPRMVPAPMTGLPPTKPLNVRQGQTTSDPRAHRSPAALDDWQPSHRSVEIAWAHVQRTGLGPALDGMLTHRLGRPRQMPSSLYLLGFYLNALRKGHRGCVLDAARALLLIPDSDKAQLAVPNITVHAMYRRFDAWFTSVTAYLANGWTPPSGDPRDQFAKQALTIFDACQAIIRSPLTDTYLRWPAIAIDGTDFPTFGNLHMAHKRLHLDGDAAYDSNGEVFGGDAGLPSWDPYADPQTKGGARILAYGPDGREIHTKDLEARSGHATATDKHRASKYVGYEAHLAVAMPVLVSTNQVDRVSFGPTPPPLCLGANLTPAGTHRGIASLAVVEFLHGTAPLAEVAADRGITYMRGYVERLRALQIKSVHLLHPLQRRLRDGPPGGIFIDQTLLTDGTPQDLLRELPLPPPRASADARLPYEQAFNDRARYRWRNHSGPDSRGAIRLACPICTSPHVRCQQVPRSLRLPNTCPKVWLPGNRNHCCVTGTVTFSADEYPLWMGDVVPHTTAHFLSYGRRNAAETLNSFLHGLYVDIDENWAEPFGTAKRAFLLSFTLAAINHHLLNATIDVGDQSAQRIQRRITQRLQPETRFSVGR